MSLWLLQEASFITANQVFYHTFSEAVASLVPCKFIAIQLSAASWAAISCGGRSVLAKSTICTWPVFRAGNANNELLLLGHSTHKPNKIRQKQFVFYFYFREEDKKTPIIYKFNTLHLKSVCSKQDWHKKSKTGLWKVTTCKVKQIFQHFLFLFENAC